MNVIVGLRPYDDFGSNNIIFSARRFKISIIWKNNIAIRKSWEKGWKWSCYWNHFLRVNNRSVFTRLVCCILYAEFSKQSWETFHFTPPWQFSYFTPWRHHNQMTTYLNVPSMPHFFNSKLLFRNKWPQSESIHLKDHHSIR